MNIPTNITPREYLTLYGTMPFEVQEQLVEQVEDLERSRLGDRIYNLTQVRQGAKGQNKPVLAASLQEALGLAEEINIYCVL